MKLKKLTDYPREGYRLIKGRLVPCHAIPVPVAAAYDAAIEAAGERCFACGGDEDEELCPTCDDGELYYALKACRGDISEAFDCGKENRQKAATDAVIKAAKLVSDRLKVEEVALELIDEDALTDENGFAPVIGDAGEMLADAIDKWEKVME